jgi:3-dehydroquinate synthase
VEVVHVKAAITDYDVLVGSGIIHRFPDLVAPFDPGGELVVVTDGGVDPRYPNVPELLRQCHRIVLEHGERLKTFAEAESLIRKLADLKVGRDGLMVAFGGGVIGDLAGFVAAIYLRGIAWVVVPTTLLAQVDSAIGGKVAVNLPVGKNLVGAFYPPRMVVCDTGLLHDLPEPDYLIGMGEVIKTALIGDPKLFETLEQQLDKVLARDPDILQGIVSACVKVKADVVSRDERDRERRAVLNLGHTIAHALEGAQGFEHLPHGIAVLQGILAALPLSQAQCGLSNKTANRVRDLIERLPIDLGAVLPSMETVKSFMERDKKVRNGQVRWVLLKDIGVPVHNVTIPMEQVKAAYTSLGANK